MSFSIYVACEDGAQAGHGKKKRDCDNGGTHTEEAPPLFRWVGDPFELQEHFLPHVCRIHNGE